MTYNLLALLFIAIATIQPIASASTTMNSNLAGQSDIEKQVQQESRSSTLVAQRCQIPVFYGTSSWGLPTYIAIANMQVYAWTGERWVAQAIYAYGPEFNQLMQRYQFVGCLR